MVEQEQAEAILAEYVTRDSEGPTSAPDGETLRRRDSIMAKVFAARRRYPAVAVSQTLDANESHPPPAVDVNAPLEFDDRTPPKTLRSGTIDGLPSGVASKSPNITATEMLLDMPAPVRNTGARLRLLALALCGIVTLATLWPHLHQKTVEPAPLKATATEPQEVDPQPPIQPPSEAIAPGDEAPVKPTKTATALKAKKRRAARLRARAAWPRDEAPMTAWVSPTGVGVSGTF